MTLAPDALVDFHTGVGAAIAVAAIAAQEPVAALFATPAVLGAAAFAVNELKPVPVTYVGNCVEINQCVGCTRQFFTKSFLGDDVAVLARSSGEELASPRRRAGVASMEWRLTRRFSTNAP